MYRAFSPGSILARFPGESLNPPSAPHELTEIIGEDSTVTRHGFRSLARDLEET